MSDVRNDHDEVGDSVIYEFGAGIAWISMNRPKYGNAQNSRMTYQLDAAFMKAVADDDVKVIVLRGEGKHFSAGHDIGTPGQVRICSAVRIASPVGMTTQISQVASFFTSEKRRLISGCVAGGAISLNQPLQRYRVLVSLVA